MRLQPVRNYPPRRDRTEASFARRGYNVSIRWIEEREGKIPEWQQLDGQRQKSGRPAIDRMSSTRNIPSESTKDGEA